MALFKACIAILWHLSFILFFSHFPPFTTCTQEVFSFSFFLPSLRWSGVGKGFFCAALPLPLALGLAPLGCAGISGLPPSELSVPSPFPSLLLLLLLLLLELDLLSFALAGQQVAGQASVGGLARLLFFGYFRNLLVVLLLATLWVLAGCCHFYFFQVGMAYPSLGKMVGIASSLPLPFSRLSSCAPFKALKCALVRVWIYALCKACKEFFPIDAQGMFGKPFCKACLAHSGSFKVLDQLPPAPTRPLTKMVASSFLGGQKSLVKVAKWGSREAWRTMVKELAPQSPEGEYLRPKSQLRAQVSAGVGIASHLNHLVASFGDTTLELVDQGSRFNGGHAVYLGNTCPWCHRVALALAFRQVPERCVARVRLLDDPERASRGGWAFDASQGFADPVFQAKDLREVYDRSAGGSGGYVGRCTAPLLVDRQHLKAVSQDSEEIVRMIATAEASSRELEEGRCVELFPGHLRSQIQETHRWTYHLLSNAVYRAGFSTSQEAFARACRDVAEGLQRVEELLSEQPFLSPWWNRCGDRITEADVMMLPCACRFDAVYASLFLRGSCGLWREGPARRRWLQRCWALPMVPQTVDVQRCQESRDSKGTEDELKRTCLVERNMGGFHK
ncbi:unnamed protein product [Cladocopium goreaui]|uniref:Glutathione S-transferase omega-like 2 (Glutathione-dependent dehydroascorbate reductase) n=1 Tax=Cladocopium goreaui TaxID=2562237 RepID=A0A9P1BT66_9DINO|nr:unnamed protein product [Cladocopium goreaui]